MPMPMPTVENDGDAHQRAGATWAAMKFCTRKGCERGTDLWFLVREDPCVMLWRAPLYHFIQGYIEEAANDWINEVVWVWILQGFQYYTFFKPLLWANHTFL